MIDKECSICTSTNTKKCKCGAYYCEPHMSFHYNFFCKFGKKAPKEKGAKDE